MNKSQNKIKWYMLSFMCFSTLWAFSFHGVFYCLGIWKRFKWFHILQWNTGYLLLDSDVCTVLCTVRTDGRRAWFRI